MEGSDPLQTRAFPVEGHVGFFLVKGRTSFGYI